MDGFIFFLYSFSSTIFLHTGAAFEDCPTVKCNHGAPDIHFPFRAIGQHPQRCGFLGFDLVCKENTTQIHFPSYGELVVKSISYNDQKLHLLDPRNCVHQVFLNLDLSLTPFEYYNVVKNYTYLNCSTRLSHPLAQVPCLSGASHHVYTVESSLPMLESCRPVKTVAIPFSYSPYLADNSFGLALTWNSPVCQDCEPKTGQATFQSKSRCFNKTQEIVVGVSFFIFIMATLINIKIFRSKKVEEQRAKENQLETEELLGDFKTISVGFVDKAQSNRVPSTDYI